MDKTRRCSYEFSGLRSKTLERLHEKLEQTGAAPDGESQQLLQELRIYQIELELQNEELREAQRELERSRDRYQDLFNLSPMGYVVINSASMILQANQTLCAMIDMDMAELLDKPLSDHIHPNDKALYFAQFRALFKNPGGKRLEVRMLRRDKTAIMVMMEGRRADFAGKPVDDSRYPGQLLLSISDITRKKLSEAAIVRAKRQWEQTFDAVPDLIAIIDDDNTIVRVNLALANRLGVSPGECVGKKCFNLLHSRADRPDYCPHQSFAGTGAVKQAEIFSRRLNGDFLVSISPFQPDQNDTPWSIHVWHDISDRLRAEKAQLKSRNLESLGVLAGGIAHDFNNILTAAMGHIDLARWQAQQPAELLKHLDRGAQACMRASDLANRLLTFAEGGSPRMHPLRIDRLIKEIVAQDFNGSKILHRLELQQHLKLLTIDASQVRVAIQNILTNAREAMPAGGELHIKARNVELTSVNAKPLPPGAYVQVEISDQGIGIEPAHLDKIFDPYFSTKAMGAQKGVGLGLAIAHSIIKRHKGHIQVESHLYHGTTVRLFLPVSAEIQNLPAIQTACPVDGNAAEPRLLVMDDERIIWAIIAPALQHMGCRVDFAANGEEALSLYRRALHDNAPYAAVILDLIIQGGMGGKEVAREISALTPGVPAAVISGYSTDPVFSDFRQHGFSAALKKPFHIDEFKTLVGLLLADCYTMDENGNVLPHHK